MIIGSSQKHQKAPIWACLGHKYKTSCEGIRSLSQNKPPGPLKKPISSKSYIPHWADLGGQRGNRAKKGWGLDFGVHPNGFGYGKSIVTILRHLRFTWVAKMAICGHFSQSKWDKMAKFVTLVLNMLETWFWWLSLGFWAWKIHWDHSQTSQVDLSGQNGCLWPLWPVKMR